MREEVKDSPILLDVGLGIGFKSMNHIWEIHPVVNKEDRKVVSSKVKVSLCSEGKNKNQVYYKTPTVPNNLLLKQLLSTFYQIN
jgi:hypothetical protein